MSSGIIYWAQNNLFCFSYSNLYLMMKDICCDVSTLGCMFRKCAICREKSINYAPVSICTVPYREWGREKIDATNSVCVLFSRQTDVDSFKRIFGDKFNEYLAHQFTARHQHQVFRKIKQNLKPDQCAIIMDWSLNATTKYANCGTGTYI